MEEGRINGNELKTELKRIRTQIIKPQKKKLGQKDKIAFAHYRISNLEQIIKEIQARYHSYYVLSFVDRMPPKRTSTSETLAITLAAIRQLINDGISSALKAQVASMANTDNTNKNTGTSGTPVARKGINNHKRKFEDRGNTTNNNNYSNNRDKDNYPMIATKITTPTITSTKITT
ncbi:hypothetical protein Tco_0401008 [Tanacetum coccineum]